MINNENARVSGQYTLDGKALNLADLPTSQSVRWSMRRKSEVLTAIRCGLLTVEDAFNRYAISLDELISWQIAMNRFGPEGLCARHRVRQ